MTALRLVFLRIAASDPYAGMAWMHMQIAAGPLRLGHDVHYLETTSSWPYDPVRRSDYGHHSRAAREIAAEYFRGETVLARLLDNLSL